MINLLEIRNVSMKYKMNSDRIMDIKEYIIAFLQRKLKHSEFEVFNKVNFDVKKGEVIGIIGRNGAGKSTLLKIISGVLEPTEGEVIRHGNIVPMLELGSGFDIELSGRENIFLNGSILGYSEEFLKEKYREIVEFSELGDFIESPLRNYSSGMVMRLAFSIATVVNPEILIVDEILAVGDEAFQLKSKRRMLELMSGGTTVLFVSHSIGQIRELCNRVVWLENGKMRMIGDTKVVCDAYQELINPSQNKEQYMKTVSRSLNESHKYLMDVLFIYGKMDENYYWRVSNQREQLLAGNMNSSEIYYEDITIDLVKKYRAFIFVQCPKNEATKKFVETAKDYNRTILFDFSFTCEQEGTYTDQYNLLMDCKEFCDGVIISNEHYRKIFESNGLKVFCNKLVASDRIAQVATWAKYDRDVLPYLDTSTLKTEDELINYNKALIEVKKHQEDGIRIGCVIDSCLETIDEVIPILIDILNRFPECKIIMDHEIEGIEEKIGEGYCKRLEVIICNGREEKVRWFSNVDLILRIDLLKKLNEDEIERAFIYSFLVGTPFILHSNKMYEGRFRDMSNLNNSLNKLELLNNIYNSINRNKKNHISFDERLRQNLLTVYTGNAFEQFLRDVMAKNIAFLIDFDQKDMTEEPLKHAIELKKIGYDVVIISSGTHSDDIAIGEVSLPVINKNEIYIYGSFDKMVATCWSDIIYMQSYTNIRQYYYLVQKYETITFDEGQYNKFCANQTYNPYIPVKFITTSQECKEILENKFKKEVSYINYCNTDSYDEKKYANEVIKVYQ